MELHPTYLNGTLFFVFATVIVSSALAAVTVADAQRRSLAFFLFALATAGMIYLESGPLPALSLALLGVVSVLLFWRKASQSDRTGVEHANAVAVEEGPNRPVAFFITLCFVMVMTPIWGYSIWRGHQVESETETTRALLSALTGENVALLIALLTLLLIVCAALLSLRQRAPESPAGDTNAAGTGGPA